MVDGIGVPPPHIGSVDGDTRSHGVRARDLASAGSQTTTQVSVSARAQLGAKIVAAAHASNGVDDLLVARIGAAMRDGTYKLSPAAIAAAMVGAADGDTP